MSHLIKIDPQIHLRPEESGYELRCYVFISLLTLETKNKKKKENVKINAVDKAIATSNEILPMTLIDD